MFVGPDWALRWPTSLFVSEAIDLLCGDSATDVDWSERAALLLEEAFASTVPRDEVATVGPRLRSSPLDPREFLRQAVAVADTFRPVAPPRPYWHDRDTRQANPTLTGEAAQRQFAHLIAEFEDHGYFARDFPQRCVDDAEPTPDVSAFLQGIVGIRSLWPLRSSLPWEDDIWFSIIEILHDHAARPRRRSWHDFSQCGWHYSAFAVEPGQVLYRWKVNDLLARSDVRVQLADDGEDIGRLVTVSDDARAPLIDRLIDRHPDVGLDPVAHAVALFRGRGASFEAKRSAVKALAEVLEQRRSLLKSELLTKDEAALFSIANQFHIRHGNDRQRGDYAEAFIEWIFWWYAATIELSDQLASR